VNGIATEECIMNGVISHIARRRYAHQMEVKRISEKEKERIRSVESKEE
jgi:hypothetical protein